MRPFVLLVSLSLALVSCAAARVESPVAAAASLPVREVTVFKDGHAYVLREEPLPADHRGSVVLDELPTPVLGTFWPYASGGAQLVHARAARVESDTDADVVDLQELVEANMGRKARVKDVQGEEFAGVLRPLKRRADADASASILVVESEVGARALPLGSVRWIEIEGTPVRTLRRKETKERLTLRIDGGGVDAKVGVVYVQQGLRWIPSYKLDIDGAGRARVQLQAALQNDLIDLVDATVHLVVGVPSFRYADLIDPIALEHDLARVSAQMDYVQSFSNVLSNSLRTQVAGFRAEGDGAGDGAAGDSAAGVSGGAAEDLFVFTIERVTLAKGERMTLPLREFELSYRDVYTLEIPFSPPMELREQLQSERVVELAKALAAPKVMHALRLRNASDIPLTTGPALVLLNGRVLAQGELRYTPSGLETDLAINSAIDVRVELEERERGRVPDAEQWNNERYGRVDIAGAITLRNEKERTLDIEVRRRVLGTTASVGQGGTMRQLDLASLWGETRAVSWWGWWSWPYWWFRFNGFGEFRWELRLEPGKLATLDAGWHYFWR